MIRAAAHYQQDNQNKEEPKNREKHTRLGHVVDMAMRDGEYWNHLSVEKYVILWTGMEQGRIPDSRLKSKIST